MSKRVKLTWMKHNENFLRGDDGPWWAILERRENSWELRGRSIYPRIVSSVRVGKIQAARYCNVFLDQMRAWNGDE